MTTTALDTLRIIKKYARGRVFWTSILLMLFIDGSIFFLCFSMIPEPYNLFALMFGLPLAEEFRMSCVTKYYSIKK